MIPKYTPSPQNLKDLTLQLNQSTSSDRGNDSVQYLDHLVKISKRPLRASFNSNNHLEPLEIIAELLDSEGFQYGEGKDFLSQLKVGKLDCELSSLLYFILLDENTENKRGNRRFTPTTFHKRDDSPHLAIKILHSDDSLWETTPKNGRSVAEPEYMNSFETAIHHPFPEILHIPYANLVMNPNKTIPLGEVLDRLNEIKFREFTYPSIDFYINFIHHTLANDGDKLSKVDLAKLEKLVNRINKISEKPDFRKSAIYANLAYLYELLNNKKKATLYYLKAIKALKNIATSDLVNFTKAFSYMKLFSFTGNKQYRQKSIQLFRQIQSNDIFKEQVQFNLLSLLHGQLSQ